VTQVADRDQIGSEWANYPPIWRVGGYKVRAFSSPITGYSGVRIGYADCYRAGLLECQGGGTDAD
jgi:hypothetical protein